MEEHCSIKIRVGFVMLRLLVLVFHLGKVEKSCWKEDIQVWDFEERERGMKPGLRSKVKEVEIFM